jgi:hypothetical protein
MLAGNQPGHKPTLPDGSTQGGHCHRSIWKCKLGSTSQPDWVIVADAGHHHLSINCAAGA